ncbi:Leukotoxin export ATP-binding protein LtxB [Paenibacillus plantiphilus]|uniref:Leukotoxin export ATP-binding protein LtxB n=1 Tax=Paenibacillus plantiphilus TaxID=2905650 RepID=A0ABM9CQ94_9BACL|nr:ABC transporter ATP-binding protein [Paenibacillus plantiphilus]CAH1219275.1 Leukotoxin export ATP-binding protein LtxB [Paenibacillus plantiphilus]
MNLKLIKEDMKLFKYMLDYLLLYKPLLVIACILPLLEVFHYVSFAAVQEMLINNLKLSNITAHKEILIIYSSIAFALIVCFLLFFYINSLLNEYIQKDLMNRFYHKSNRINDGDFERKHTGDRITRLTVDVPQGSQIVGSILFSIIFWLAFFLTSFYYLAKINLSITILVIATTPIYLLVGKFFTSRIRKGFSTLQMIKSSNRSKLQEMTQNMISVKTFRLESFFLKQFRMNQTEWNKNTLKVTQYHSLLEQSIQLTANIIRLAAFVLLAHQVMTDKISLGALVLFISLISALQEPIKEIANEIGNSQKSFVSLKRLMDILRHQPPQNKSSLPSFHPNKPALHLMNLSFNHHNHTIIDHVNIKINHGEKIAIIGPSGSGKSTLAKILCGLHRDYSGSIACYGENILDYPNELSSAITYVAQDAKLFSGSVKDILTCFQKSYSQEAVINAAKMADAHDFISLLPNKYDTLIKERGHSLSGGQKQKLAIACALLRNTPIIIFDESTSALDNQSEQRILEKLCLLTDKTMIFITHRHMTLKNMNRILKLSEKRLVETIPES